MVKPDPETGPKKKTSLPTRQRKWHSRVFTGCVNCRRRHVKCDEGTPSCSNCNRLSLSCNFDRRFVFKAVKPTTPVAKSEGGSPISSDRRASDISSSASSGEDALDDFSARGSISATDVVSVRTSTSPIAPSTAGFSFISEDYNFPFKNNVFAGKGASEPPPAYSFVNVNVPQHIENNDDLYLRHFMGSVATYLIIYDTPSNSNPYRRLPSLMNNSMLLHDAMKALGAMHLSGLPDTQNPQIHHAAAMKAYGNVVTQLRDSVTSGQGQSSLELLATTLLLCMFEKMSSNDAAWKIHLVGAAQIFQSLYSPQVGQLQAGLAGNNNNSTFGALSVANTLPLRRFLVSLMSYLDVAASVATGDGTLIQGEYWETFGGGWEYNLGVPSFAQSASPADRAMAQIRQSWSRVMSIQAEISKFVKVGKEGLSQQQRELYYSDLTYRLRNWQASAPDIFSRLENLSSMPHDATPEEFETLTAAACVQAYALSCSLYLDRVATRRIGNAAVNPSIAAFASRILTLVSFQSGINQLAVLWPLLTVGLTTVNAAEQNHIRKCLLSMQGFGFRHVSRVLETLEYAWEQQRMYGTANYEEFERLISSNLVP